MKILMPLIFYPRGGSAQVARYLSRALLDLGHDVHLLTGTLRDGDPQHDADVFYTGIPLTAIDYTAAWQGFQLGEDPISDSWDVPFHPSYEDKPGVPDRVFYGISQSGYSALLACWRKAFHQVNETFPADLLHLHHLTYAHTAAAQVFPSVPRLTQLHGTEIKMLENLAEVERDSDTVSELHGFWRGVLREAVETTSHFAAISPDVRERAVERLSVDDRRITTIPNGVDTSLFRPLDWSTDDKLEFLRKILVDDPQGWAEGGAPGTVRYQRSDIERFTDASGRMRPLAIFVGRFLDFKRVPLLMRAVAQVNRTLESAGEAAFNLLVWGGMPGEWEGEHPHTLAHSLGLPNVFFCGWLPHDTLSQGLNLADLLVAPSFNEPFGQVYLEAMATGMPVVATRSGGPLDFVADDGPQANGWFAEVDDVDSLAGVLHRALTDAGERQRRGANALRLIREEYDWRGIAKRYLEVYESISS
jgi:glycosyltransferase involved in cell wall biosynthesis